MILLSLFFLALSFGLVSGQQRNATVIALGMRPNSKESVLDSCQALKEEAQEIRQEGYSAIDKADIIRDQAYRVKDEAYDLKDEAYDIKESALEARSALETTLLETLILMRSQATATNLYIQEIRTTLSSLTTRIDKLEQGQGQIRLEFGAVKQGQDQRKRVVHPELLNKQNGHVGRGDRGPHRRKSRIVSRKTVDNLSHSRGNTRRTEEWRE